MSATETSADVAEFKCDQCEKSFKTQAGLSIHKLRAHEGRHWSRNSSKQPKAAKPKPKASAKKVRSEAPPVPAPVPVSSSNVVEFCPRCGCHIGEVERTLKAVAEIDRDNPQVYRVDVPS